MLISSWQFQLKLSWVCSIINGPSTSIFLHFVGKHFNYLNLSLAKLSPSLFWDNSVIISNIWPFVNKIVQSYYNLPYYTWNKCCDINLYSLVGKPLVWNMWVIFFSYLGRLVMMAPFVSHFLEHKHEAVRTKFRTAFRWRMDVSRIFFRAE